MKLIFSLLVLVSASVCASEGIRVSEFLKVNPPATDAYLLGAVWATPEEKERQDQEYRLIQQELGMMLSKGLIKQESFDGLSKALAVLRPTGRVRVAPLSGKWLEASLKKDPLIKPTDRFVVPSRPEVIRVMDGYGAVCETRHREGVFSPDYVNGCIGHHGASWAWVVQPDGRVQKVGLNQFNVASQDQPAPGAWIWVPNGNRFEDGFNLRWASWLATQGVSSQVALESFSNFWRQMTPPLVETTMFDLQAKGLAIRPTANVLGTTGLVQMPSARMREAGYFGLGYSHGDPYSNVNVFFQPVQDLEFGFRYVDIGYELYGPGYAGEQSYKDKNVDAKLRLLNETTWLPELSIGSRDIGGTGLFSSEYLVGSKRFGRLDYSMGIAWGNMGGRASLTNPVSKVLGTQYTARNAPAEWGGQIGAKNWFKGPAAIFAGVEYQSPWNAVLKLEYDANDYRREPFGKSLQVRSPFNFGVVYELKPGVDFSIGYERGNTWVAGFTLYTDFSTISTPKVTDPVAPLVVHQRPASQPNWAQTAEDIERLTEWRVQQIYVQPNRVVVQAERSRNPSPQLRLDKAIAVVHRDAQLEVESIEVQHIAAGSVLAAQKVDRQSWVESQTQPQRTMAEQAPKQPTYPDSLDLGTPVLDRQSKSYYLEPGLDFVNHNGGPDGFLLYQLSAALNLGLKLPGDIQVKGLVRERLSDNYANYKYVAPSNLPRVRTDLREYFTTSSTTLANLSVYKTQRLGQNLYGSAYLGYFEEMFGGVGSELLYRQPGSRWAFGLDVNRVKQRNFAQNFGFRDYQIDTGHITGYWMTPWEGIHTSLSIGQYLAGDRGATLAATKVFSNGSVMGAYVTKTNLSAQQFGEGSFDKGIYWSVPFDALLTSSSRFMGSFGWKPLFADGGARVIRPVNLFGETFWLGPDANSKLPSRPPNRDLAPDEYVEPFARKR